MSNHYVPARWGSALKPAPDATRILGTDGKIWLVVPVQPGVPDATQPDRRINVYVVPEDQVKPAVMWLIDLDATCVVAVPDHAEAVSMLLRGFPSSQVLAWEVPA